MGRVHDIASARKPPPKKGRLMSAQTVAEEIFGGEVSAKWVLRTVPGKLDLGYNTKMWYEDDVWRWVASHRESA